MTAPTTCVLVLWLVWLVGWQIAARTAAPAVTRQTKSSRLAHASLLGAGALLLFFHPSRPAILSRLVLPASTWLTWGGVVVTALGLAFATWARVHLGRLWSASVTLKADHTIVRTGPYAMSRHPIYTGLVLAFIGTTLVYATVGSFLGLVLLTLGILLKIRQEEELLLGHFGDAYRGYQSHVPALIPRFRSSA